MDSEKLETLPFEAVDIGSRVGLWDRYYANARDRGVYGDIETARYAADFFNHPYIEIVEDWGCGLGGFKLLLASRQQYIGVDGSKSPYADTVADLELYQSTADAIHVRHVLEHNPAWRKILKNALNSFRYRMVLTLFTPWSSATRVIARYPNFLGTNRTMVDIAFNRAELLEHLVGYRWTMRENLRTRTQYGIEHVIFIQREIAETPL